MDRMKRFEINCDVGESAGQDENLMQYLDACSIACGGHAGDSESMRTTVLLAKKHRVKVGAHPSFPDRVNFGRKIVRMTPEALLYSLIAQVEDCKSICSAEGVPMVHIKAHGALYNLAAKEPEIARILVKVLREYPGVAIMAPWGSVIAAMAKKEGITVRFEGFADRKYTSDGTLVNRSLKGAVITDPEEALQQVLSVVAEGSLLSIDQKPLEMKAETFCIHGDNPNAIAIARVLNEVQYDAS